MCYSTWDGRKRPRLPITTSARLHGDKETWRQSDGWSQRTQSETGPSVCWQADEQKRTKSNTLKTKYSSSRRRRIGDTCTQCVGFTHDLWPHNPLTVSLVGHNNLRHSCSVTPSFKVKLVELHMTTTSFGWKVQCTKVDCGRNAAALQKWHDSVYIHQHTLTSNK